MDKLKTFAAVEKFVQKGQTDKALENLEQILKYDPTDLKALNRAADLYLKESQFERAVDCLKKVGGVYSKDGFYSKAVAIYKRVLKIDQITSKSTLIGIHEQLATLYGQLGLISDAMGHFSVVVDFYDQAGDQNALLEVLKKVSDLDPNNVESQIKLIELLLAQNRSDEGASSMDRLVASVQDRKSSVDLIRVLEKAIEFFPKDSQRLQDLVDVYIKENEPKKALAKIQISFKSDPRNPVVLELLSTTFMALKQPDKAKAVDVELIKLYKQTGDAEKAASVEARMKGQAIHTISLNPKKNSESSSAVRAMPGDDAADPVESLVKALPLSADEKKIISECDVYFKYGLAEKAYEVLKARLEQFPQSLILRWKLKTSTQDLKKVDETIHLLSEIILLAKSQNLEIWASLAAGELQALDDKHPALAGMVKPVSKAPKAEVPKAAPKVEPQTKSRSAEDFSFKDFESSEVSIVIDEELSEDSMEFSEISFKDLNADKSTGKSKMHVEAIELLNEVSEVKAKQEPEVMELSLDDAPESILSEADFTADELSSLDSNLAPANSRSKSNPAPMEEAVMATELELMPAAVDSNAISAPIDLSEYSEISSDVVADDDFAIRQGIEEVSFFRTQGLNEEAETLLKDLKRQFPQVKDWKKIEAKVGDASAELSEASGKLSRKTKDVETLGRKVKVSVQEDFRAEEDSEFIDLAGELHEELSKPTEQAPTEIRDVFNAFKAGVSATISEDDWQTHFDLGVAYREMGLHEDAIEEFKLVAKVAAQRISAYYQMGLTKVAMELYAEAKDCFDKALTEPGLGDQEKLSVSYELGEVLLKLDNRDKAKKLFESVKNIDPEFREVKQRIKALG